MYSMTIPDDWEENEELEGEAIIKDRLIEYVNRIEDKSEGEDLI